MLVHEAWLRLSTRKVGKLEDRDHFLSLAARVMRQVLVDHARKKGAAKRELPAQRVTLNEELHGFEAEELDLVELDDALVELARLDEERARLVELRFFGGLNENEVARVLGASRSDVQRKWRLARAWLARRLSPRSDP